MQEHQEEQKTQWGNVEQRVTAAKQSIDTVMRNVQEGNPKRRQLATGALADLPGENMPGAPYWVGCWGIWGGDSRGPALPEHKVWRGD